MTSTHDEFFIDMLLGLNLPTEHPQLRALAAVSIYESSDGDLHWWNPLAVTTPVKGSKPLYPNYKGACAQIYPSYSVGLVQTIALFSGPHWADVRAHLADDTSTRGPMLDAFTRAYTWADVDFRALAFTTADLDARLAHILRGPS